MLRAKSAQCLLAHVDGACPKGEPPQTAMHKPRLGKKGEHLFALHDGGNRARQVGIGMGVARYDTPHKGDDGIGIELIELAEWEMHRRRELYDTKHAAGSKYPVHLGKALRQMLEIAYAIGYGDGIEAVVGEAEVQAVAGLKSDMAGIATRSGLLPRHIEHTFRKVYTRKLVRMQHIVDEKCHVARAGRHVEQAGRVILAHHIDGFAPPPAIDAESHHTIHQVVCRSYRVEHVAHLPGLGSRAVVGFYIFGFEAAHCRAYFETPTGERQSCLSSLFR